MLRRRWLLGLGLGLLLLQATLFDTGVEAQEDFASRVVVLVNEERAAAGLKPLTMDSRLASAAQAHSQAMADADEMLHQVAGELPLCASGPDRYDSVGYPWYVCGENIAAGYLTPESVMQGWMASAGHRANILSPNYRHIGVGYVYAARTSYGTWWTQDFGDASDTTAPTPTRTNTPAATAAPGATATPKRSGGATSTPRATATPRRTATPTAIAGPTRTPTATPIPKATATPKPTATPRRPRPRTADLLGQTHDALVDAELEVTRTDVGPMQDEATEMEAADEGGDAETAP
jgi:hypothetical protein